MKSNKIIKWLYGLFMFVPFLAIGVKSMYVTFNKNAKDSYGGQVQAKYETNEVTSLSDLEVGNIYHFTIDSNVTVTGLTTLFRAKAVYNVPLQPSNNIYVDMEADNTNAFFYVRLNANGTISFPNQDYQGMINISNTYIQYPCEFDFVLYQYDNPSVLTADNFSASSYNVYENQYNAQSTLDNAFYYAIDEFNNIGFDKINFVSWFDFLYNNTNVYTTFINCYVNYMLFVSLAFFIPRVLYWFINFAYSLTDSFSSKSNGGGW